MGDYLNELRYHSNVDVMLNLGSCMPYAGAQRKMLFSVKLIQVRLDAANLARIHPAEVAIVADIKLAIANLLAAIPRRKYTPRCTKISTPPFAVAGTAPR